MARDLSDVRPVDSNDDGGNILSGVFTTEFWATVGGLIANLLVVLAAIGWVSREDSDMLTTTLATFLGAAQTLIVNGMLIWKYIASRTQLKQAVLLQRMSQRHDLKLTQMRLLMNGDLTQQVQAMKMMGLEPPRQAAREDSGSSENTVKESTFNLDFEFKLPECPNKDCPIKHINPVPVQSVPPQG